MLLVFRPEYQDFCNFVVCMKHFFLIVTATLCVWTAKAQDMERIFAEMPDSIVPVMTKNNRLDCIDFYKSKMKSNVENIYGGKSELLALGNDYLFIRPTQKSAVAMKRLATSSGDTIIVVVSTYLSPAKESDVVFYSGKWERLSAQKLISPPEKGDFYSKSDTCDAARLSYARAAGEDAFVYAELSENEPVISYGLSLESLMPEDEAKVTPYLSGKIVYKWNGKAFER